MLVGKEVCKLPKYHRIMIFKWLKKTAYVENNTGLFSKKISPCKLDISYLPTILRLSKLTTLLLSHSLPLAPLKPCDTRDKTDNALIVCPSVTHLSLKPFLSLQC